MCAQPFSVTNYVISHDERHLMTHGLRDLSSFLLLLLFWSMFSSLLCNIVMMTHGLIVLSSTPFWCDMTLSWLIPPHAYSCFLLWSSVLSIYIRSCTVVNFSLNITCLHLNLHQFERSSLVIFALHKGLCETSLNLTSSLLLIRITHNKIFKLLLSSLLSSKRKPL